MKSMNLISKFMKLIYLYKAKIIPEKKTSDKKAQTPKESQNK